MPPPRGELFQSLLQNCYAFSKMFTLVFMVCLCVGLSASDDGDLGYGLNIGNAINVFANYGDLSQVTQVISADYEEEDDEDFGPPEPFREKNLKVFLNVSSREKPRDAMVDMNILLCETFEDLLDGYFQNFKIEGTDKPWKAFMGDWVQDEIMHAEKYLATYTRKSATYFCLSPISLRVRTLGLEYDSGADNCCYVLLKLSRVHKNVKIESLDHVSVKSYVQKAVDALNVSDVAEVRKFMKSYGTHYIDSYVTGNFIYQVFKFKRSGYNLLRAYIRVRNNKRDSSDTLRFYFASYFLKQVGDIRIASGNKTIEKWARQNLRDSQYLYHRPSLLRLHYSNTLAQALHAMLGDAALLGLGLNTLAPLFRDRHRRSRYVEVLHNDLMLWEVNA